MRNVEVTRKDSEDDPLFSERMDRDGWKPEQEWSVDNRGLADFFRMLQPAAHSLYCLRLCEERSGRRL